MRSRTRGEIHGVLIIDKPKGPTSFDIVAEVRRKLHTSRVGHTGTLDPMATGVLPICVGEATKLVPFLTDCDKSYEADVVFGVGTNTGDAEGEIIARASAEHLTPYEVSLAAAKLVGTIEQTPPMYSAIKIDGQRLHELARQGKEVEREPRPVVVHALTLTPRSTTKYRLSVTCGKGTYVRVLAEDLGKLLGVPAHLSSLRRTRVGRFETMVPLAELTDATPLVTLSDAVMHLPTVVLDEAGAKRIRSGQERWLFGLPQPPGEGRTRLVDGENGLVAVIARSGQKIVFERVFVDSSGPVEANTRNLQPL